MEIDKAGNTRDLIQGAANLTYGGTLVLSNLNNSFADGDAFQLFSAGSYSGAFTTIVPATPGAGLSWNTSTLATDGNLRVAVATVSQPRIGSVSISGGNLVLSGTGGPQRRDGSVRASTMSRCRSHSGLCFERQSVRQQRQLQLQHADCGCAAAILPAASAVAWGWTARHGPLGLDAAADRVVFPSQLEFFMRLNLNYARWLCVIVIAIGGKAIAALSVENETLAANWDAETGLTLVARLSGRVFIKDVIFASDSSEVKRAAITHQTFGRGRALEFLHRDGSRDAVMLFPGVPFALIRSTLHNHGDSISVTERIRTFSGVCGAPPPGGTLITLGTGGLLEAEKNPGSYAWLAVAEPQTRNGVVFGWLTHDRGSGVLFTKIENNAVIVDAQIDYGKLRIAPGKSAELETLAIGYFDDARLG
jgi:hypothetical protein